MDRLQDRASNGLEASRSHRLRFDVVMVARGDLGVEMPLEEVHIQANIIETCQRLGRPVIVATQMLESMIEHSRPTRAEVSDVAGAIQQGSQAVMLSGESAVGAHPVDAVSTMRRIAEATATDVEWTEHPPGRCGILNDPFLGWGDGSDRRGHQR